MLSENHLSENSFKHKDGKDGVSDTKKCHRMAIPSYKIYSKELIRFTNLKQTEVSLSHFK
jgi:CRISPR/Cas system CMR-associated protein Cmr5 small subunit